MYNFQKFTKTHSQTDDRISITKSSTIGLTGHFVRQNLNNKPRWVVLYFDAKQMAIGVRFTNEDEEGKISIIYSKEGYGAMINVRSFLRLNNINVDTVKGKHVWKKQNIDGVGELYVFELKYSAVVAESNISMNEVDNDQLGQVKADMG